jgi:hypothetical protein
MECRVERGADGKWIMADVCKRGHTVLIHPSLNKGTAFSEREGEIFELDGDRRGRHLGGARSGVGTRIEDEEIHMVLDRAI